MKTVTLYSLPRCVQCNLTKRWLDRAGIEYATVYLNESPDDAAYVSALGHKQAPVVIISSDEAMTVHWSGFDPDLLESHAGRLAA